MFFYAAKLFWFVASPLNLAILALTVGVVLHAVRFVRTARAAALAGLAILLVGGFSPFGTWLLATLEDRIPRTELTSAPHGIIVLGGAFDNRVAGLRDDLLLTAAAERPLALVELARRFPDAKLVYSGGTNDLTGKLEPETNAARRLFTTLGVAPSRVIYEPHSRNTWDNATMVADLIGDIAGQDWLLVTSAFHMPRAIGVFRQVGLTVHPWPVDYRTPISRNGLYLPHALANFANLEIASREYVGLAAYYLSGRSSAWLPNRR